MQTSWVIAVQGATMDEPSLDATDLLYPKARVLDAEEFGGLHNLLLITPEPLPKVWRWYAKRIGVPSSPIGTGERAFDSGKLRLAFRRFGRLPSPEAPFEDDESPQALTAQFGCRAVTVVLSRAEQPDQTTIMLFVFG